MGKQLTIWSFVAAHVLCGLCGGSLPPQAAMADEPAVPAANSFEARARTALGTPGDWEFVEVPLQDVADYLSEKLQVDVLLEKKALADLGIDAEMPVNLSSKGIMARSALRLMFEPLGLTYMLRDEAIWITSQEAADAMLVTRVYPVGELVRVPEVALEQGGDYDSLIQAISGSIATDSWDEVGGVGSIEAAYGSLVVAQTGHVQAQIESFLDAAHRLAEAHAAADQSTAVLMPEETAGDVRIRAALQSPVDGEFVDVALRDALAYLADVARIPIVLDGRALEDSGVDQDTPITAKFAGIPLKSALGRILPDLDLTYLVHDEVLQVTTEEVAAGRLVLALYPVDDLVLTDPHDPASADFDTLINVITSTVHPDTWDDVGGPSTLECLPRPRCCLIIPQTELIHDEIGALLANLRRAKGRQQPAHDGALAAPSSPGALQVRVYSLPNAWHQSAAPLLNLIRHEFGPETWDANDGAYIESIGVLLVVKHRPEVHRKLLSFMHTIGVFPSYGNSGQGVGGGFGGFVPNPPPQPVDGGAGGGGGFF